ncbi:pancreatic lipase-related protein 3-like [Leptidea sinapis]|uniref:pancreatic lipase-related protein 3-like n=1 Tax=Leptidea sinapis TaxID=189913 RepID=UPI0021C2F302|nr:pancreatic lipase-related protein 3-like [Leptidea sinapis]
MLLVDTAVIPELAKFSISSILDTALPSIYPLVDAGSKKCEALKKFFGLTYVQMQGENTTMLREKLNLDLITQNGNKKYNITSTNRLQRIMRSRPIVILIHGYMETSDGVMVQALGTEFLKISDLNVFALDGRNVIGLEYLRSSTYVRFMGEELGRLLSGVIKRGKNASMITLIGHSLGAHVAGVAGEKVKQDTGQTIGRITGLDPAGPCFSNVTLDNRLDKTDAEYVDIIHTNGGILGMKDPVGHKDFFPNNGMSQPDCYLSTCDHSRAWELYAESINNPRRFPARKCDSWSEFQSGSCMKNEVSYMGINSRKGSSGLYFLTTGSASPFGLGAAGSG